MEKSSMTDTSEERLPRVVYVAGYGRSGSTLLDILLGNAAHTAGCGELWGFFKACESPSAGSAMAMPEIWQQVCSDFHARLAKPTVGMEVSAARGRFEKLTALPRLLAGLAGQDMQPLYRRSQRALLAAIRQASDCEVIVDSSKTTRHCAGRPLALATLAGIEVRVIHLVRDGRGVLWSQLRGSNAKLEAGAADPRLAWAVPRTLFSWTMANLACWLQSRALPAGSVLRVRYEDLVAAPARELRRIGAFAGIDPEPVIAQLQRGEAVPPGMQFAGNRLRLRGISQVREDTEWQRRLPRAPRLAYWFFCWPWHLMFCRPVSSPRGS